MVIRADGTGVARRAIGADNLDKRRQPFGSELIRFVGLLFLVGRFDIF